MQVLPQVSNSILELVNPLQVKRLILDSELLLHQNQSIQLSIFIKKDLIDFNQMQVFFIGNSNGQIVRAFFIDYNESFLIKHYWLLKPR